MSAAASPPQEGIESHSAFQVAMAQTEVEDVQPAKLAWHVEDHSLEGARWSGSSGASLAVAENGTQCPEPWRPRGSSHELDSDSAVDCRTIEYSGRDINAASRIEWPIAG